MHRPLRTLASALLFGFAATWLAACSVGGSRVPPPGSPAQGQDAAPSATAAPVAPDTKRELGRLEWGRNPATRAQWTVAELRERANARTPEEIGRQTRRMIQVAEQTLNASVSAVAKVEKEGVLSTDPRYRASDVALRSVDPLSNWAMCARVAERPLAERCQQQAFAAVDVWVATYRSEGNPINDNNLIPIMRAIDLLAPLASESQRAAWFSWVGDFARQGDRYYAALSPSAGTRTNNWATWRLLIRGVAGAIIGDEAMLSSTHQLFSAHVARNLLADGSSIDFHERDALHYHVYDVEPMVHFLMFVPGPIDHATAASIARAVGFLEPYVSGRKTHVEFVNSGVKFDVARKEAGIAGYANLPWDPKEARPLLRLARTQFPAIRPWTAHVVDEQYSPWVKQLAALFGG